jgi:hypothetical protein
MTPTDLPDGQFFDFAVQSHPQKYFVSQFGRNSFIDSAIPFPQEGRFAVVTDVGAGCNGRDGGALTRRRQRGR